jgi:cyclic beta-1,2-glucan synthetase
MTDDLVWLPFVTAFYIEATGDTAVLDETASFLTGPLLSPDEEERYGHYQTAEVALTLYEHGCRALEQAATHGRHGLPLMGTGDWNDGMNRVGIHGKGESVWLGWFLAASLKAFAELGRERDDDERADRFDQQAEAYRAAIEAEAWDGEWYRRAYYDDGTPLGSQQNKECRLDAIAQSWAVLTGLGDPARAEQAMSAVEKHLIKEEERLILLFTPPFDQTRKDPGYIKGYLPGIRENGGQYTHAALWSIWAFAELGQSEKAEALFRLINPILRADTPEKVAHYVVEPYVISADVYGVPPHEGRGGWTWYTGSSGWMYRLGLEGILGLHRRGNSLQIRPQIPPSWPGFKAVYRFGRSAYHIQVENAQGDKTQVWLDGKKLPAPDIPLQDDGREHEVVICL